MAYHNAAAVISMGVKVVILRTDSKAARIVVAWKDTPETRRAVSGALPLIKRAEHVFVATVGGCSHPQSRM